MPRGRRTLLAGLRGRRTRTPQAASCGRSRSSTSRSWDALARRAGLPLWRAARRRARSRAAARRRRLLHRAAPVRRRRGRAARLADEGFGALKVHATDADAGRAAARGGARRRRPRGRRCTCAFDSCRRARGSAAGSTISGLAFIEDPFPPEQLAADRRARRASSRRPSPRARTPPGREALLEPRPGRLDSCASMRPPVAASRRPSPRPPSPRPRAARS